MRRVISAAVMLLGVAAMALMIYLVANYGATAMRRVDAEAYRWRLEWANRR